MRPCVLTNHYQLTTGCLNWPILAWSMAAEKGWRRPLVYGQFYDLETRLFEAPNHWFNGFPVHRLSDISIISGNDECDDVYLQATFCCR